MNGLVIMFTISNDELKNNLPIGDNVICPNCGKNHKVKYGNKVLPDGSKVESNLLAFVYCTDSNEDYLAGIAGKLIK